MVRRLSNFDVSAILPGEESTLSLTVLELEIVPQLNLHRTVITSIYRDYCDFTSRPMDVSLDTGVADSGL